MTNSTEPSGYLSERPGSQALWRWRLLDDAGSDVTEQHEAARQTFSSQGDAETWVGESWRELSEAGVDAVTLLEGDREVYGPMSLQA